VVRDLRQGSLSETQATVQYFLLGSGLTIIMRILPSPNGGVFRDASLPSTESITFDTIVDGALTTTTSTSRVVVAIKYFSLSH